jgi:hypothetical protein
MSALSGCPKAMTYGPCGGVRPDGGCEIPGLECPFVTAPLPVWPAGSAAPGALNPAAAALADRLAAGGVVIADLPARALDARSLAECAAALSAVDAILCGDAPHHRVQFPPAHRAGLLVDAGATAWPGLNCRDRNAVALEGELAALAHLGVAAVHCVTGDHPVSGHRPDATSVFDLDSTELVALAAGRGLLISVGESPAAPPTHSRPARLASKEHAGADVCFVDHSGGVAPVTAFVHTARTLGVRAAMIACVPMVCDPGSATQLLSFGVPAPSDGFFEDILATPNPRAAGIAAAIEFGRRLLDTGLLAGVNLSGGPAEGGELAYAEAQAEVAERLRR